LFEENAELLNMFTKFRDMKTKEQQSSSMELAEHAKTVMTTLDEGIKSLDDMDAFLTYLHNVGASHTKIPGFNRQYFWVSFLKGRKPASRILQNSCAICDITYSINLGTIVRARGGRLFLVRENSNYNHETQKLFDIMYI